MSYNYRPFYMASTWHLFQEERSKLLLKISFIAGVINVVLNLILIPFFGIKAAAVVTFISFIYLGFSGFIIKGNKLPINYNFKKYFVVILISALLVFIIKDISIYLKILITIFIMLSLYFVIKNFIKHNHE